MASYVIFDESTNEVLKYRRSGDTNDAFRARTDVIIEPDVSLLDGIVARKYWKVSNGAVVEMTTAEKTTVDSDESTVNINRLRLDAKKVINLSPVVSESMSLLAIADELRKQINVLRNEIESDRGDSSLPNLTFSDIKSSAKTAIDAGDYDS